MVQICVQCPSCGKKGDIEVSEESLKGVTRGLLAVNIPEDTICSHTFFAYIDKNFKIRDYFKADFKIDIPELPQNREFDDKIVAKNIINLDLVKLNLPAILLVYIIKSIFKKAKIAIISNQTFIYEHFHNFFNYITQESFEVDITLISNAEYRDNKKDYKDCMVFEENKIVNNYKKSIDLKKLKVENQIVKNFLSERNLAVSYIILRNEIHKAYQISKEIADLINELKKRDESVNTLKINSQLEEIHGIKISTIYLNFLIQIVEDYFGVSAPSITDSFLKV